MDAIFQLRTGVKGPGIFGEDHRGTVVLRFLPADKCVTVLPGGRLYTNHPAELVSIEPVALIGYFFRLHSASDDSGTIFGEFPE